MGLPVLVLGIGPTVLNGNSMLLIVYATTMLIMGAAMSVAGIWRNLFVLQNVDEEMMGRVTSYSLVASIGGLSLGEALAGPLSHLFGVSGALIAIAATVAFMTVWAATRRGVRTLTYSSSKPASTL